MQCIGGHNELVKQLTNTGCTTYNKPYDCIIGILENQFYVFDATHQHIPPTQSWRRSLLP